MCLIVKINPAPTKSTLDVVAHGTLKKNVDLGLFTSHSIDVRFLRDGKQLATENYFHSLAF
jgi:hypothetical protein